MNLPVRDQNISKTINSVKETSISRFSFLLQNKSIELVEGVKEQLIFGHEMTMIFLSSAPIGVIFKAHFSPVEIAPCVADFTGKKVNGVAYGDTVDFMKEFCNLTIGNFKIILEQLNVFAGVSLPVNTRGFDEIFFPVANGVNRFQQHWRLRSGSVNVICSAALQVLDESSFLALDFSSIAAEGDDGDGSVEFL